MPPDEKPDASDKVIIMVILVAKGNWVSKTPCPLLKLEEGTSTMCGVPNIFEANGSLLSWSGIAQCDTYPR